MAIANAFGKQKKKLSPYALAHATERETQLIGLNANALYIVGFRQRLCDSEDDSSAPVLDLDNNLKLLNLLLADVNGQSNAERVGLKSKSEGQKVHPLNLTTKLKLKILKDSAWQLIP